MPKNRKRCSALTPDCPHFRRETPSMETPQPSPKQTTIPTPNQALNQASTRTPTQAPSQAPNILPRETNEKLVQIIDAYRGLVPDWLARFKKHITGLETQVKQREQDIQRTTEMFLKLHEDIARWNAEKMQALADIAKLELQVEALARIISSRVELD